MPAGRRPLSLVDVDTSVAVDAKLALALSDAITVSVAGDNVTDASDVSLTPTPSEQRLRAAVQIRF